MIRVLALVLLLVAGAATPAPAAARPNVLLVVSDDQRTDTMDVMPATRAWLADGGVTYDDGVVTTPLCCRSRGSIFSGQYVHNPWRPRPRAPARR